MNMIKIAAKRNGKGFSLLEVMIAIAIIGIVVAGFMGAMSNAINGALKNDQMETARTLAVGQMEYVKKLPFAASYTPGDSTVYDSVQNKFINYNVYSASITAVSAAERNINIQKLTVTIFCNGVVVATLDDCKVK
jgi:prepilin-type N-terminal cleavage/methylation domain-containing protein